VRRDGDGRVNFVIRCVGVLALLAWIFILPCSCRPDPSAFTHGLSAADALIAAGTPEKALSSLAKLRKKASSVQNWLSIAKRERQLGSSPAATVTLEQALAAYPSNQFLVAVLADTWVDLERYDKASAMRSALADSSFAPLIAYSDIMRTRASFPPDVDPGVWIEAYDASGDLACIDNAAVLYAIQGKSAEAVALADRRFALGGSRPLFPALLSYDAGYPEKVRGYFARTEGTPDQGLSADELALLADAEYACGKDSRSRELWSALTDRYPDYSPIAWYDRAISGNDPVYEKQGLEACLSRYPAFYPAVCRYVRSVPRKKVSEPDAIETELRKAGLRTLEMIAADERAPVDSAQAAEAIARALSASDDIRFRIEELRFNQLEKPDERRTAGSMWKLLEKYPHDPVLVPYAQWYFGSIRQFDAAFGLGNGVDGSASDYWRGLEAAMAGDLEAAETSFGKVASDKALAWCALANLARISEKNADLESSAEYLDSAIRLAPDDATRSELAYESAKILTRLGDSVRARQMLGHAIDLDPENYAARTVLRKMESSN
jgi:tetratricopeptide (TPR) repeat protein